MQDRLSKGIEMPKIAIIYATGMGRTKKMAEAIASGAMTIEREGGSGIWLAWVER